MQSPKGKKGKEARFPQLLVLEAEVQSLIPFICGRGEVFHSLILVHLTPLLCPLLIAGHIVGLNQEVQDNVHTVDGE